MSARRKTQAPQPEPSATDFRSHEHRILLLQGGGALGAYHGGVYEGIAAVGFVPDWVVGISIGAINAAIIAGNEPSDRLARLKAKLRELATGRQVQRGGREEIFRVSLVGYTNAGKSTLFNLLTGSDAYAADQLFATLDPTVRRLRLPHTPEIVLADTVGFVRDLPHELVAAFRSTLLEARDADLLLHVVDASDPEHLEHMAQVEEVLTSIGAGSIPVLTVFNKIDRVAAPPSVERDTDGQAVRVWMSAVSGAGLDLLKDCLHERFGALVQRYSLALAPSEGRARARLYRDGLVRQDHPREQGGWLLEVEASRPELEALCASEGIDFALRVSPCLPLHGFVESGHAAPVESA